MTGRLTAEARAFCGSYALDHDDWRARADALGTFLDAGVKELNLPIQQVTARAKDPVSLLAKCRDKGYTDPDHQATDLVAARVVTYFSRDVDTVVDRLRALFDVTSVETNVKHLGAIEFGYRSAHVMATLRSADRLSALGGLGERLFEVQVRTVLGHAWAEIEHEEVYKSRVEFEPRTRRDLAAIAGMLEYLDGQFELLRIEKDKLIERYVARYQAGEDGAVELDAARLIALLEVLRPGGKGWRSGSADQLPPRSDAAVLNALGACGVTTANALRSVIASPRFRGRAGVLASRSGVGLPELSHLAVAIIAVGVTDIGVLRDYPELTIYTDIATIFKL